jgi:hypothetical protein
MSEHPPAGFMTPLADPASIPELTTIANAVAHGAKLSSFRLLDVACGKQHRLAQVIATTAGPVLYAGGRDDARGKLGALVLEGLEPSVRVCVMCECRAANLPISFIIDWLALGIRRAAYP